MSHSGYSLKFPEFNLRFPLEKGVTILGRSADCDICIDHSHVSREHCIFELNNSSLFLRDLNSTNGTRVNRKPISREQKLEVGDELALGQVQVTVDFLEQNHTILLDTRDRTLFDSFQEIDRLALTDSSGQEFVLSAKDRRAVFSIGRTPSCDVLIQDIGISANHAQIVFDKSRWQIEDLASTNGVFLNGKPVAVAALKHGDKILIGKRKLIVSHGQPTVEKPKKVTWFYWLFCYWRPISKQSTTSC